MNNLSCKQNYKVVYIHEWINTCDDFKEIFVF